MTFRIELIVEVKGGNLYPVTIERARDIIINDEGLSYFDVIGGMNCVYYLKDIPETQMCQKLIKVRIEKIEE